MTTTHTTPWSEPGKCGCWECSQEYTLGFPTRFIICGDCGNKRCPKATHHDNACSGSNAVGQAGSRFENWPAGGLV